MNRRDRPKVIANFAMTADGKVTTRHRTPVSFTSPYDKKRLLEIRALGDAVLVGRNTVSTDTMSMTLRNRELRAKRRARGMTAEPLRVIVSHSGRLDTSWKVFQVPGGRRIIFSTLRMPAAKRRELTSYCDLHLLGAKTLSITDALTTLRHDYNVRTVVCEGGPTLLRSLIEARALDVLYLTVAPAIFGGRDAPTLTGTTSEFLPSIAHFRLESMRTVGDECYLRYRAAHQ